MIIKILNDKEFEEKKKDFVEAIHDIHKNDVFFNYLERERMELICLVSFIKASNVYYSGVQITLLEQIAHEEFGKIPIEK